MAGVDQRNHLPPWHPPASHTAYADTSALNSAAQHAPQYKQQALAPDAALALAFGNRLNLRDSDTKMRPYQHRLSSGDLSSVGQTSVDGSDHHMSGATPQRPVGTMTASSSSSSLTNMAGVHHMPPQHHRRQPEEDIFSIVGGVELDTDSHPPPQAAQLRRNNNASTNSLDSAAQLSNRGSYGNLSLLGDMAAEEQPSRILFIRGLDPTVSDEALVQMFEAYGEIRSLYTACKSRGFIVLSFYDLRASCLAIHALQGAQLGGGKLQISFSTPKDNMGDKDAHQGTVTVFNIAPTATPMQLAEQFAMYGDIKDVREDPQIQGCWLLEYYDIRHAAAAYKALNRSSHMHATLPVVSESTPSQGPQQMATAMLRNAPQQTGMRNVQSSHVLNNLGSEFGPVGGEDAWQGSRSWDNNTGAAFQEQLASLMYNRQNGVHGSSQHDFGRGLGNSSQLAPGQVSSYLQQQALLQQPQYGAGLQTNNLEALLRTTALAQQLQNNTGTMPQSASSNSLAGQYIGENQLRHSGSSGNLSHIGGTSPSQLSSKHGSHQFLNQAQFAGLDGQYGLGRRTAGGMSMSTGDLAALYEAQLNGSSADLFAAASSGDLQALNSMSTGNLANLATSTALPQSQSANNLLSGLGYNQGSDGNLYQRNLEAQALLAQQQALGMGLQGLSSQSALDLLQGLQSSSYGQGNGQGASQMLHQQNALAALGPTQQAALLRRLQNSGSLAPGSIGKLMNARGMKRGDDMSSGGRLSRRNADPIAEAERKAQQEKLYSLDLERVLAGEDKRTTLMIKNIPNKYTQKMLLTTIDEKFRGTYDFFYLPIDFKNKCNVGYAFINMVRPEYIVPLVQKLDRKKWEKFNSEKVCNISYARIQGKLSLVTHFQNSSLLHEDKRCRPILFNSNGEVAGEQEPFPVGPNMRVRNSKPGVHQGNRSDLHLNAPEMWQNTERGKELMSRGMRVDLNQ